MHFSNILTWQMQERMTTACLCIQSRLQNHWEGRGKFLQFTYAGMVMFDICVHPQDQSLKFMPSLFTDNKFLALVKNYFS